MGVERPVHEREHLIHLAGEPRRDEREDVGAEDRLIRAPAPDVLGRRVDVAVEELVDHLLGLRDQDRLAVGVEVRSPGPPGHLPVLPDGDRDHPLPGVEPEVVTDDHSPGGEVQARRERRCGGDHPDLPLPEPRLDDLALFAGKARVVERRPLRDAGGKCLPHIGRGARA
ncbi:hypothetical protein DSECCO2_579800 [anaerobic digester metagenome]